MRGGQGSRFARSRSMKGIILVAALVLVATACDPPPPPPDTTPNTTSGAIPTLPPTTPVPEPPEFPPVPPGSILVAVRSRGFLMCGVGVRPGFADEDSTGELTGFDVDFCRDLATTVLGDPDLVDFIDAETDRFDLIVSRAVDVLFRTTTHTLGRDARVDFGPVTFYDGQRLMGRSSDFGTRSGITELDGHTVCVGGGGTTSEANIKDVTKAVGAAPVWRVTSGSRTALEDFADGICDAVTADGSSLAGSKLAEPSDGAWVIFPPAPFSREPLGPVYQANDSVWAGVVNWTVWALMIADEKGITSENVNSPGLPRDAEVSRLLGECLVGDAARLAPEPDCVPGELQLSLGLDRGAFRRAIEQVGNYDQIFTRNLGPIGLQRAGTLNASYLDAGLIYAPPLR